MKTNIEIQVKGLKQQIVAKYKPECFKLETILPISPNLYVDLDKLTQNSTDKNGKDIFLVNKSSVKEFLANQFKTEETFDQLKEKGIIITNVDFQNCANELSVASQLAVYNLEQIQNIYIGCSSLPDEYINAFQYEGCASMGLHHKLEQYEAIKNLSVTWRYTNSDISMFNLFNINHLDVLQNALGHKVSKFIDHTFEIFDLYARCNIEAKLYDLEQQKNIDTQSTIENVAKKLTTMLEHNGHIFYYHAAAKQDLAFKLDEFLGQQQYIQGDVE